ncbi:MAG: glycoside hydrolase family 2 [Ferruginibacter sp.]|nr:glycoside hydrolase family 2 [Ferruginibacter sp.]
MNRKTRLYFVLLAGIFHLPYFPAAQGIQVHDESTKIAGQLSLQSNLGNIPGRKIISLNGKWQAIIDPADFGIGSWAAIWKDQQPKGKTDFFEYSFEGGTVLDVPGDFNSQMPELNFYESTVWYKKKFSYKKDVQEKLFIHFAGVNYIADVFLNNEKIGSHEGGFTAFQFELTGKVKEGENSIIVRVNNQRVKDGIPSLGFDWFNYGGITREVNLVATPLSYIEDYFFQLKKGSNNEVEGWVQLGGLNKSQSINIRVPEAKINFKTTTGNNGRAAFSFPVKLNLWTPENPTLYPVKFASETDSIIELIGFRNITVKGTEILLNNKPVFLKGISFHEEIPQRKGRAYTEADALQLLTWTKELGCNFVRLAHYPQNEYIVRMADKIGLMVWEEIPVYQGIDFGNAVMQNKMNSMLTEMVNRDKNRCGIIIWSMSNETSPGKARNTAIINMAAFTRTIDPTRLIASAFNRVNYSGNTVAIEDTLSKYLDVLSVNEYLGWYKAWPSGPADVVWKSAFNKPLIMSEFGGEALYGHHGPADTASSWSEEYQEQLYKDQVAMLKNIPFLRGTCPWILVDFRSPRRLHPTLQDGQSGMWNRKGLLSDKGYKKKAWYIMEAYYRSQ